MGGDRHRLALDLDLAASFEIEGSADETSGVCRDLHAGGDIHRVSHRGVLDAQVRSDLADDDRPRVDADANVQVQVVTSDRLDDLEARRNGAMRVVLMGDRCAEEREDRIAHQPSHRAFVAVDRDDQELEDLVHDLGPRFGIEALRHGRGTDDVAEQHRHDAPLALCRASCFGGLLAQRAAAPEAEPRSVGVLGPADGADHRPTITTSLTETAATVSTRARIHAGGERRMIVLPCATWMSGGSACASFDRT